MRGRRRSLLADLVIVIIAVVTGGLGSEAFAQAVIGPVRIDTAVDGPVGIAGTIRVLGCDVAAADLLVRARPLRAPQAWSGETRLLRATAADGNGSFQFRFEGLASGVPYRVGVRVIGPSARGCPKLAWTSDRDPFVLPGSAPLHFSGFGVRSSLEVLATTDGRTSDSGPTDVEGGVHVHVPPVLWVGADALNFRDPAKAVRRFRWRSDLSGVDGGRLQVSLRPFPKIGARSYDPCAVDPDSGLIRQVDFDAVQGGWTMLPAVDFHEMLLPEDPAIGTFVDSGTLAKLDLGMPLHVRVLPRVAGRVVCDPEEGGTPPEALLAAILVSLAGPPPDESQIRLGAVYYTAPEIGKQPFQGEVCYRITKPHDLDFFLPWDTSAILFAKSADISGGVIKEGASFCIPADSGDDGWFDSVVDSFGSVLSGIVDGIGKLVNFTSNLWEEIQDEAVKAVGNVIDDVGIINCGEGSDCQKALETGLEVALASMGVPPSLPNFDDLVDMGVDYVAVQIASEAGIPPEVADYASDKAQDLVKKAAADMKAHHVVQGLPDWLVPDLHFRHAFLTMELYGRGLQFPYFSRPGIIRNNTPIYAGAFIPLPQRLPAPGEKPILFPMVLPPNLAGLPDPPQNYDDYQKARVDKNNWVKQRYTGGCYDLVLTGLSAPGGIAPLRHASFSTADGSIACTP